MDNEDEDIIIDRNLRWGWLKYRPNCLQKFLKPKWALFFICCGTFFQGFSVNGLMHINLPVLEYKFNLKSKETGFLCGSYNIASIIFLIPVTFFGSQSNASKPKWYGSGMILMGLGSLTFIIPEIIVDSRTSRSTYKTPPMCNFTSPEKLSDVCENETQRISPVFWIFLTGNLLNGAGGCMLYTLAVTYIEEGVSTAKSAAFLGIFYIMAIIGSAFGFVTGGFFLHVDNEYFFGKSSNFLRSTDNNESYGGVWWLGFFISGFMLLLAAIPNLGFPAELPDTAKIRQSKMSEAHFSTLAVSEENYISKENISKQLCNVLKNPTFVFLTFAGSFDSAILHSTSIFMPKILEIQFNAPEKVVAVIMAVAVIFGGVCGVIAGGLVVTYYELNCNRTIKVCITTSLCGSICSISFLLHCKEAAFVGVNTSYNNSIRSLQNYCNNKCSCLEEIYSPVCGFDGLTYYSPCFAGCQEFKAKEGHNEFYNCTCMTLKSDPFSSEPDGISHICTVHCQLLLYFAIGATFSVFFVFLALVPGVSATLRCVHKSQKSLAVGIQWLTIRLFGVFAPVILGSVLDLSCIKWRSTCSEEGACVLYNNKSFSWRSFILGLSIKLCGFISSNMSLHTYKPVNEI